MNKISPRCPKGKFEGYYSPQCNKQKMIVNRDVHGLYEQYNIANDDMVLARKENKDLSSHNISNNSKRQRHDSRESKDNRSRTPPFRTGQANGRTYLSPNLEKEKRNILQKKLKTLVNIDDYNTFHMRMKKYSDHLTNVSKANSQTNNRQRNPNVSDSKSQMNNDVSAISNNKVTVDNIDIFKEKLGGTGMFQYQSMGVEKDMGSTLPISLQQHCNSTQGHNFQGNYTQNYNATNYTTDRTPNTKIGTDNLLMMMQAKDNYNSQQRSTEECKSTELRDRIFHSYHSKINTNLLTNQSPCMDKEHYQTQGCINANKFSSSNGKIQRENILGVNRKGYNGAYGENSYNAMFNMRSNSRESSTSNRDLTPQSSRGRELLNTNNSNQGSNCKDGRDLIKKELENKGVKCMRNFLSPNIEKQKNQFFTGNILSNGMKNQSSSPTIKENIINNILDTNRFSNYGSICNSPNSLQKSKRINYGDKYMSKENCKTDFNSGHYKGYNTSPNNYKESKEFKQQMQDIGLLKDKSNNIQSSMNYNSEPKTNTFQSVMNSLNKKEESNTANNYLQEKTFFQNMRLHNNPNIINSGYNENKFNSTSNYISNKLKNKDVNNSNAKKKTINNKNKSCLNSPDTGRFKNGYIVNAMHSSMHGKENKNVVLNQQDNPHMSKMKNTGNQLNVNMSQENNDNLYLLDEKLNVNNSSSKLKNLINNCSSGKIQNSSNNVTQHQTNSLIKNNMQKSMINSENSNSQKTLLLNSNANITSRTDLNGKEDTVPWSTKSREAESYYNSNCLSVNKRNSNIKNANEEILTISEEYLNELLHLNLESFASVGEIIWQMLRLLKKKEDPYEIIRNYTDLVQDPVYECISVMFENENIKTEINNALKLERWGIIFLFFFNLNGKLSNTKVSNNMLNLQTHICHNFHILAQVIEKSAQKFDNKQIINTLTPILNKLKNPYINVSNELILIIKRNNDIIKSNLKACMMYIPKSSQTALTNFLKKMENWSIRYTLEKGFDAFLKFFKEEGVISINYLGMSDNESDQETESVNQKTSTPTIDKTKNKIYNSLTPPPKLQGNNNNDNENLNDQFSTNTPLPTLTNNNANDNNITTISNITQDNVTQANMTNRTFLKENNMKTPLTNYEKKKFSEQKNSGNFKKSLYTSNEEVNDNELEDENKTIKGNTRLKEDGNGNGIIDLAEDIPTANKSENKNKRSGNKESNNKKSNNKQQVGSFEQYLSEIQGPSLLFQPKTMENSNLLPKIRKDRKYTLVLDLDETLVHFEESEEGNQWLIRPYANKFLEEICQYYELVIFTAGLKDYADCILDRIDEKKTITHRLYRHNTDFRNNVYTKDISKQGRDMSKILIVDNNPDNFQLQPENGIYIKSWYNDPNDRALVELAPLLKEIVKKQYADVRIAQRQFRDKMMSRLQEGNQMGHQDLSLDQTNRSLKMDQVIQQTVFDRNQL